MSSDISGVCQVHSFESATELCRRCGLEFCDTCIVSPFGAKKPYCKECAMTLGGVRAHVTRNALPARQIRRRVKEFETITAARRRTTDPVEMPDLVDPVLDDPTVEPSSEPQRVPSPASIMGEESMAEELPNGGDAPVPSPTGRGGSDPADGVAPPIDWNRPFG